MVSRMKERGTKTDSAVNILEIFKPHKECSQPRKILIEGQPGMGKTTYCNKVAYDWAKNCKAEDSFPDFQVVLLLKCRDINSDLWEAIDDQLLPRDMKKEEKEKFFTFVRDHQSKVLLVLDGLDELPTHKLPIYKEIIQGRMLPKCYLVVTARPKAGIKVRECCDTLLEVEGFTKHDAESYIRRYFKTEQHLAETLLDKLRTDASLEGLTANPLNAALLCLLCEDFQGDLPKGRTLLYFEIVQCVLKRYRRKKELSETDEDLTQLYHTELKHLGCLAMNGLLNDEMYFDHSAFGNSGSDLIPALGFLSVQPGRSKRRPRLCYGFLHKSFQEFFAAFYLSCQLVDEEISPESLVADTRYFDEFKQVLLFACGILAQRCETKAVALIASLARQINQSVEPGKSSMYLYVALSCIEECEKDQGTFGKELARSLGSLLEIQECDCRWLKRDSEVAVVGDTLETNSTVTKLILLQSEIGDSGAASLAKVMETNSTLTLMYLGDDNIFDCHAAAFAKALQVNSTLTTLSLSENYIGDLGAAAIAKAMEVNSTLENLVLCRNEIGDSGAAAMAKAVEQNSTLKSLDLSDNDIGDSGAAAMAKALEVNSTLTYLDLSNNGIDDLGAIALAEAMRINSTLTKLDLGSELVSASAAAEAEKMELCSGFCVRWYGSGVGDSGAVALAKAIEITRTLTYFALSGGEIGDTGVLALAKAMESNSTLTELDLSRNDIGDSGAAALAEAMKRNSTLTRLDLHHSKIGDSGAAALAEAMELNSTLTRLNLHRSKISDSGAAKLATALETNSTVKQLDLSVNNIGDSGAAALAKAMEPNSTLIWLDLSYNEISDSGALALAKAMELNSTLKWLDLSYNEISDSGALALAKAMELNSTLKWLNLVGNKIDKSGTAALAKARFRVSFWFMRH